MGGTNVTVVVDSSIQASIEFFYFHKYCPSPSTTPPPPPPLAASDRDTLVVFMGSWTVLQALGSPCLLVAAGHELVVSLSVFRVTL